MIVVAFILIFKIIKKIIRKSKHERVLLIPEGTVSVTRWLADRINTNAVSYPIKLFYLLNCYRNELISNLTDTKRREFEQFGLEILGSDNVVSDIEILYMVCLCLERLGIDRKYMRPRINDVAIYRTLIEDSKIDDKGSILIKEYLDNLAESKAGKHPELLQHFKDKIYDILNQNKLNKECTEMWTAIIESDYNNIEYMKKCFNEKYHKYFNMLNEIQENFAKNGIDLLIDPCVIRSHEYYTGLSFEFDVIVEDEKFIEIAGGGRYDRLVGKFLIQGDKSSRVPCTGFAFGFERIVEMLNKLDLFNDSKSISTIFNFKSQKKERIKPNSIQDYFKLATQKNIEILVD